MRTIEKSNDVADRLKHVKRAEFHIIYVSVNAIRAGCRTRTKDAIGAIRHIFLEADRDGPRLIAEVSARAELPAPSYVLESSPGRVHVFWRASGFTPDAAERLQKHLARELGTDEAATPCSQTTRLPGYRNHKRTPSPLVTIAYGATEVRYTAQHFPAPPPSAAVAPSHRSTPLPSQSVLERARRYLSRVEPAIAGQHGDQHTFRVCCRIVRGFALTDDEAVTVLADWNARCNPPWREGDLRHKIAGARRYGREPIGVMLHR
jgi:hypothetical protein